MNVSRHMNVIKQISDHYFLFHDVIPHLASKDLKVRCDGAKYLCQPDVQVSDFLAALFSEKVRNMSPDEIRIPPEPPGRCSSQLQVNTPPQPYA